MILILKRRSKKTEVKESVKEIIAPVIVKQVNEKFKRGILNEGRDFGLGFSILKRKEEGVYDTMMPFTACKDYLNDFVYVEGTGKALDSIYGFQHKYTGEFKDKDCFLLGLRPLHTNHGSTYKDFDKIKDFLNSNKVNIVRFINNLEVTFGVKELTTLENHIDDVLILKCNIFWFKFSFLFSLFGLLIRCFLDVTEEEVKKDVLSLIETRKNCFITGDISLLMSIQKNFTKFDLDKFLDYKYQDNPNSSTLHNYGVVGRMQEINRK